MKNACHLSLSAHVFKGKYIPNSSRSDEDGATAVPEATKKFFESILRASDDKPSLVVNKVLVRQIEDNKRHFNSGMPVNQSVSRGRITTATT